MQEDLHLVKAWLNVRMDPVVGSNQSIRAFWQRIETFFHEHKDFRSTRNKKSLQGRWTFINGMVQRFCGHYARTLRNRRSGTTEPDMIAAACQMFQATENEEFTLLPCWVELRHHPKWQSEASRKKQKTSAAGSPASTQHVESSPGVNVPEGVAAGPSSGGPRPKQPPGRNRSKEVARGSSSSNSASGSMIEIFDRQLAMKEKVEKDRAERFAEMMRIEQ
ncbi:glutathione S-transferase T3-like [Phragmites australis]|uniref:glutathione S-transferase T3-like n=1 Tax=Phragmites australis TaxID=29695 RepID=UPI002D77A48B|nr:glutathione S-transferase T3-like [Phragmites australis]